jgi:hypothetical protein
MRTELIDKAHSRFMAWGHQNPVKAALICVSAMVADGFLALCMGQLLNQPDLYRSIANFAFATAALAFAATVLLYLFAVMKLRVDE